MLNLSDYCLMIGSIAVIAIIFGYVLFGPKESDKPVYDDPPTEDQPATKSSRPRRDN